MNLTKELFGTESALPPNAPGFFKLSETIIRSINSHFDMLAHLSAAIGYALKQHEELATVFYPTIIYLTATKGDVTLDWDLVQSRMLQQLLADVNEFKQQSREVE